MFATDLIINPDVSRRVAPLVRLDPQVHRIVEVPLTLAAVKKYDGLWDFDALLLDPRFGDTPLVDYFLDRMGVSPDEVAPPAKNNRLRLPRPATKLHSALANLPGPLLLFHPLASAQVRSMPPIHARRILADLLRLWDGTVATAVPMEDAHPRFVDLSRYTASVIDLCHVVARAQRIVTVDTSIYHIAAAFGVPTLALFTTIAPELRVGYYPNVAGVLLDGAATTPRFRAHNDVAGASAEPVFTLWERFDIEPALQALEALAARMETRAVPEPTPAPTFRA